MNAKLILFLFLIHFTINAQTTDSSKNRWGGFVGVVGGWQNEEPAFLNELGSGIVGFQFQRKLPHSPLDLNVETFIKFSKDIVSVNLPVYLKINFEIKKWSLSPLAGGIISSQKIEDKYLFGHFFGINLGYEIGEDYELFLSSRLYQINIYGNHHTFASVVNSYYYETSNQPALSAGFTKAIGN